MLGFLRGRKRIITTIYIYKERLYLESCLSTCSICATQSHEKVFVVGDGRNVSSHCHVSDASSALLLLVEEALSTESRVDWGRNGYYFVEAGEDSFTNFAKVVGRELHSQGYVSDTDVDSLDERGVAKIWEWGPKFWGSSSRSRADRLRALGWRPSGITEEDTIGETIRYVLGKDN